MKNIILWSYERASWQWDILCLLIVAFIFLTPKTWFERKERLATQTSRLIVKADDFPLSERAEMERRVKEISGNDNAEIITWREKKTPKGETFYEIEIR
ncbi:MAG TPA: hypothetical protein PKY59_06000 [Pyrinomonadaceae bacterium]|nr:hypothetical protein [Pyrinomonadaceae bacterium]